MFRAGNYPAVDTRGGGGYGDQRVRTPELIERDRHTGLFPD
jgi:N-methylhydantoinase B/oxoprolinase/acetone carboxylase alpha subunit